MTNRFSPRAWGLILAPILALALLALAGGTAFATKPNPEHKVTICHATPPDTAAGGFVAITVDVASVGFQQSGHQDQHDADIIPAYSYTDVNGVEFNFYGKNLDTFFFGLTGRTILAQGCQYLASTPTPAPSESQPASVEPTPEATNPNTAMGDEPGSPFPAFTFAGILVLGLAAMLLVDGMIRKGRS